MATAAETSQSAMKVRLSRWTFRSANKASSRRRHTRGTRWVGRNGSRRSGGISLVDCSCTPQASQIVQKFSDHHMSRISRSRPMNPMKGVLTQQGLFVRQGSISSSGRTLLRAMETPGKRSRMRSINTSRRQTESSPASDGSQQPVLERALRLVFETAVRQGGIRTPPEPRTFRH